MRIKPLSQHACDKENWVRGTKKLYLNDMAGHIAYGWSAGPNDFARVGCWEQNDNSAYISKRKNGPHKKVPRMLMRVTTGELKAVYTHRLLWELWNKQKLGDRKLERIDELCTYDYCVSPHHFRVKVD